MSANGYASVRSEANDHEEQPGTSKNHTRKVNHLGISQPTHVDGSSATRTSAEAKSSAHLMCCLIMDTTVGGTWSTHMRPPVFDKRGVHSHVVPGQLAFSPMAHDWLGSGKLTWKLGKTSYNSPHFIGKTSGFQLLGSFTGM